MSRPEWGDLSAFPEVTPDEQLRGYRIATALMRADMIERAAEIAKRKVQLRRRRKAAAASDAAPA
jgi:hypothetical protein